MMSSSDVALFTVTPDILASCTLALGRTGGAEFREAELMHTEERWVFHRGRSVVPAVSIKLWLDRLPFTRL